MNYNKQIETIVEYFRNNEKPGNDHKIGVEHEHFIVDRNLNTVTFTEKNGIESILKQMLEKGWHGSYEGEYLIYLKRNDTTVTLEPGSQIELSIKPCKELSEAEQIYHDFIRDISPILNKNGQLLVSTGYHPKNSISEIPWVPKKRYEIMAEYLGKQGIYAHNMMKGTGSLQVSIDYTDEEDYIRKFQLANRLSPVNYIMFDNSPIFEGKLYNKHAVRNLIWENTDPKRCGIVPGVLNENFGYEKYAEYILDMIPIVIEGKNGNLIPCTQPFKEIFDIDKDTDPQLEYMLTMCFPDVRTKKYIEIRTADAVPYPLNFSYAAFIKGLFYNTDTLYEAEKYMKQFSPSEILNAKNDIMDKGLSSCIGQTPVLEIISNLTQMAEKGLTTCEQQYLIPLTDMIEKETNPAGIVLESLKAGSVKQYPSGTINLKQSDCGSTCTCTC